MKHFRTTQEYKDIKTECQQAGIINKEANFSCYSDMIMVYELTEGVVKYEFCIHAIDEIFLDKMTVKDLLNLKRIAFFKHTIYMKDNDGCWQREAFKMYVRENDHELN